MKVENVKFMLQNPCTNRNRAFLGSAQDSFQKEQDEIIKQARADFPYVLEDVSDENLKNIIKHAGGDNFRYIAASKASIDKALFLNYALTLGLLHEDEIQLCASSKIDFKDFPECYMKLAYFDNVDVRNIYGRLVNIAQQKAKNNPEGNSIRMLFGKYHDLKALYEHRAFFEGVDFLNKILHFLMPNRKINVKENPDNKAKFKIEAEIGDEHHKKTVVMREDGTFLRKDCAKEGLEREERYYGGALEIEGSYTRYDFDYLINSQIEIIYDKNREPRYVIKTTPNPWLEGAYDVVRFDLKNYSEDVNVLEMIKQGKLEGGEVLSQVRTLPDGQVEYIEHYEENGCRTDRKYSQKKDEKGNVSEKSLSYRIMDDKSHELLNLKRSWKKNPDNSTTTFINGKTFKTYFDDENMRATVVDDKGNRTTVDIGYMLSNLDKNDVKTYINEDGFEEEYKIYDYLLETVDKVMQPEDFPECFECFKKLEADKLLDIAKYVDTLIMTNTSKGSTYGYRYLVASNDCATTCHELGHARDFRGDTSMPLKGTVSSNEEFRKIYDEEMKEFKKKYPNINQEIISYFDQFENGEQGYQEFTAETGVLLTTYNSSDCMASRGHELVRFFPKTIAKAAELLGY